MLDEYRQRRDQLCAWLAAEPRIRFVKPAGAFYLFPDVSEFLSPDGIRTSAELAQALLDDARVAVTPGEAFDAPGFLRLSYATSLAELERGTGKIIDYLRATAQPAERRRRLGRRVLDSGFLAQLEAAVGRCATSAPTTPVAQTYGTDALKRGHPADVVVFPGDDRGGRGGRARSARRIAMPLVPRGGGTGYTGGAVPMRGGVVLSLERMNRILEIDEANLLAVVEPNVITGDLQDAVERVGLFYPPDPGVAAAVGDRRQRRRVRRRAARVQVRHDEAATCSGSKRCCRPARSSRPAARSVKNVVGYDLTQLLVGSEGTLAIITKVILRLVPKPPVQATLRACVRRRRAAPSRAVTNIIRERVVPAALELIDGDSLDAVAAALGTCARWRLKGPARMLLLEVDGGACGGRGGGGARRARVPRRRRDRGPSRAQTTQERAELWRVGGSCRCRCA